MKLSLLVVLACCLVYHVTEATVAITVGATALTATALLIKDKVVILGALLASRGRRNQMRTSRMRYRKPARYSTHMRRGRREAEDEEERVAEIEDMNARLLNIEMVAAMEPEDCFKMIFCSAATGRLENAELESTLNLVRRAMVLEPTSPFTEKYRAAAYFGASRQEVEKCEHHYQCSLPVHMLKEIFQ